MIESKSIALSSFQSTNGLKRNHVAFDTNRDEDNQRNFDLADVKFESDASISDALEHIQAQSNQNIEDILNTIQNEDDYVQTALKQLERELVAAMDTSDRGNFTDVLTATIKRLIESSKTYMNENVLPQARSILLKCGELIEFYGRKKFNLLQVRIEFGNIYSTLECKLGNHKHAIQLIDDNIELQKQSNCTLGLGISLIYKCKMLSTLTRHDEAIQILNAALSVTQHNLNHNKITKPQKMELLRFYLNS